MNEDAEIYVLIGTIVVLIEVRKCKSNALRKS